MATISPHSLFTSWILTPQETTQGTILSTLQEQVIQNQIAALAQEKTLLKFDPANIHSFLQREAELQGQIGALSFLLTQSAEAKKEFDPAQLPLTI